MCPLTSRALFAWLAASCLVLAGEAPRGLFCTSNTCNWALLNGRRVDLFQCPVDGVLNYVAWRSVEPKQGEYRFPGFDRMLREAEAQDKKLAYHIIAGYHAPDWLFDQAGVEPFLVTRKGKPKRMYLPWVETDGVRSLNTKMLDVWRQTVFALAQRVRAHRGRIWYVAMTGWMESNGLELMVSSDTREEFERLRWQDGGEDLYVQFCKRVVDVYLDAFPDVPLGIAFTDWFGRTADGKPRRDVGTSERIVAYAVAEGNRRGRVVVPMGLWTGSAGIIGQPHHPMVRLMAKLRRVAPGIAFEGPMGSYNGGAPLRQQLDFARSMGASWMQLWHHDVVHPAYQDTLREYRAKMGAIAK